MRSDDEEIFFLLCVSIASMKIFGGIYVGRPTCLVRMMIIWFSEQKKRKNVMFL